MTSSPVTVARTTKGNMLHYATNAETTICGKEILSTYGPVGVELPEFFEGQAIYANCRNCQRNARNQRLFR